jgi:hypothetical protein
VLTVTAGTERSCIKCRIRQIDVNRDLATQLKVSRRFMLAQECRFDQLKQRLHLTP